MEVREILQGLGLNLTLADKYDALFDDPGVDFVFPLLNRGGFLNSEMMLPLLCTRLRLPYLGASPILRGLSDDKHLTLRGLSRHPDRAVEDLPPRRPRHRRRRADGGADGDQAQRLLRFLGGDGRA